MSALGRPLPHDSAAEHVTGRARYIDDMALAARQLHVAIGGATIAHGRLDRIDLDAVRECDGVVDVITAADLPALRDIGPVFPGDPLLTGERVEYVGQPIFAVAATSHLAARRAVRRAEISYTEREAVLTTQQAIDRDLHVRPPHVMQRGDVETALAGAPHRLQGELLIGGQEHFYLEGQVARAEPGDDGGVTVHSSNQNPTEAQHLVAAVLGLPMHRVAVVVRRMGGAFGGKETQATACCALAAVFAVRRQVAVSCRLSRADDMRMTGKRHGFVNRYDVGFDDAGRILAISHVLAGQCGNSPDLSDAIVDRAMFHADNAYYLPAARIEGLRCKTNTVSNTAFRGFGGPQGMMAMEAVIDRIALALGEDPLTIRQRNLYGDSPRNVTPYHQEVIGFTVPLLIDQLAASTGYAERRAAVRAFNADNPVLKKGLALTPVKFGISFTVKHLNQGAALLHLYHDGSVQVNHGGTEMGQGLMIKIVQIVSEALGMACERIAVTATRTDKVPNTSATAASSGTDINGMAALDAASTLRQRLVDFLCELHDTQPTQVTFEADTIRVAARGSHRDDETRAASDKGSSDGSRGRSLEVSGAGACTHRYTWPELASLAYRARVPLSATGFYKTPDIHYDRPSASGRPFYYFANGAALTEVMIDTLTGETRILATDILHDVGRSINPAIDIGQIEGGFVQGLGWLTHEELKWNDRGELLTDGPATYKIPAIGDMPESFNVALLADSPNAAATVFRSKAVGEPPLMLAISAFAAIRDAVAAIGDHTIFPDLNAPATPEEVLRTCTEVKRQMADRQLADDDAAVDAVA